MGNIPYLRGWLVRISPPENGVYNTDLNKPNPAGWRISEDTRPGPPGLKVPDSDSNQFHYFYRTNPNRHSGREECFAMPVGTKLVTSPRRRLANQDLIDRFIRESERCIES